MFLGPEDGMETEFSIHNQFVDLFSDIRKPTRIQLPYFVFTLYIIKELRKKIEFREKIVR